tara:strand:- start:365 stop:712 length:348 start_codon:yes stop_codon:yes gene_type:complete
MINKAKRRSLRNRIKIKRNLERNRLSVFRSNNHLYAQVINDKKGVTLVSASSLDKNIKKDNKLSNTEIAKKIGIEVAKKSIEKGIKEVVFDKGRYKYHGKIKILADSARSAGLKF